MKRAYLKLLRNADEIRAELYEVRNRIQSCKNDHLSALSRSVQHSEPECRACQWFNGALAGIDHAIRHFGGRPRR